MPRAPRCRGYCFTINNYTEEEEEALRNLNNCYILFGREVGEKEQTPHLQCFLYWRNDTTWEHTRKSLPPRAANIVPTRGSIDENIMYCTKSDDYEEYGTRPMSNKRKGEKGKEFWDEQLSLAKKGRVEDCDSKLQITHFNSLNAIASKYAPMPADLEFCDNEWYYGPTRTGKSLKARTENPGHYLKMCNKWWDGYNGQEVAIIEDFDKKHDVLGHHMKIWADRYSFPAEVKGSHMNLRPKKIIVTSNYSPSEIWSDPSTLDPILARFRLSKFRYGLTPLVDEGHSPVPSINLDVPTITDL